MADALKVRGLAAGYGETQVLEQIDLTVAANESLSVIGRNGVGKSTLLGTIMGHTTMHGGEIILEGRRIDRLPVHERALAGLGFVPQEREIFSSLSVRENLEIGTRPGHWSAERIYEMFPNLRERLRNTGSQLSGGEQQMLAIARALVTNPRVLLMDEPTEGLAPVVVRALIELLGRIRVTATWQSFWLNRIAGSPSTSPLGRWLWTRAGSCTTVLRAGYATMPSTWRA